MKRVGIITYHNINNYGTMLQAYALQHIIENLNCNVEIINYALKDKDLNYFQKVKKYFILFLKNPSGVVRIVYNFLNKKKIKAQNDRFYEFYKEYIKLSDYCASLNDLEKLEDTYDIYMVGSDQTWNPYLEISSDANYLSFVKKGRIKASYAPSIGVSYISEEKKEYMKKYLQDFDFLSCRDLRGKEILEDMLERKVKLVVDPTLLLEKEQWMQKAKKIETPKEYILCYSLGSNDNCRNWADKLGKKRNIPVLHIYTNARSTMNNRNTIYNVGPLEFIYLINNAKYVCTDSFHATIFSINLQTQFFSFCKHRDVEGSENQRLKDILTEFDLKERLILDVNKDKRLKDIEFREVIQKLKIKRKDSLEYLKNILERGI